jgi:UDP-N-acetyl-D-glucosamine/UDP-N-acetyl-D-galactosamine dehydrogenase
MRKIAVVGLGYVGLPLAVAFSRAGFDVVGYDRNMSRVDAYRKGEDPTDSVGRTGIRDSSVRFSAEEGSLRGCDFFVVAVPTPLGRNNAPDLRAVESASAAVGRAINRGAIVVFESTVYPGVTEDICLPILAKASGLRCPEDFKLGYSPERINPGDKVHTLATVTKIVSGIDAESLDEISQVYGRIVAAGVYRAETIRVAEAAKVIENAQRDVSIAFMNELSMIFDRMGIRTRDVLNAAGTKWNFQHFEPGLVGGHCIGVDPYYLAYRSEELGHLSQLILAGRRINESMSGFVAQKLVKLLIAANLPVKGARVIVLGVTFKENVGDARNSKVFDLIDHLHEYGILTEIVDPHADPADVQAEHGCEITKEIVGRDYDAVVLAVAHDEFKAMRPADLRGLCTPRIDRPVLIDVKGVHVKQEPEAFFRYWTP